MLKKLTILLSLLCLSGFLLSSDDQNSVENDFKKSEQKLQKQKPMRKLKGAMSTISVLFAALGTVQLLETMYIAGNTFDNPFVSKSGAVFATGVHFLLALGSFSFAVAFGEACSSDENTEDEIG